MYQSLIWPGILSDHARRLRASLDAEDLERLADALVDRVPRDSELGGDFLRAQMLVDEAKAIELAVGQPRDPLRERIMSHLRGSGIVSRAFRIVQGNPHLAQHRATPEQRVLLALGYPRTFRQIFSGFPPKRVNPR
jgi:hypothetical protein